MILKSLGIKMEAVDISGNWKPLKKHETCAQIKTLSQNIKVFCDATLSCVYACAYVLCIIRRMFKVWINQIR